MSVQQNRQAQVQNAHIMTSTANSRAKVQEHRGHGAIFAFLSYPHEQAEAVTRPEAQTPEVEVVSTLTKDALHPGVTEEGWESQMTSDRVSIIAKSPEIPVGGRLAHFLPEWEKITSDKWVLEVIREGYKLEFLEKPPFLGIKPTNVPQKDQILISEEIEKLLQKNAIEVVDPERCLSLGSA